VVLLVALAAGAVLAQAGLQGTVTLKGGKTLTGEIKVAQVGVLQGCGIGTLLPDSGFFRLKVGDKTFDVKAAELASAEITWGLASEKDPQSWEIKQLTIIKRDGTTLTGTPTWSVQATSIVVDSQPAIYAFPKAGMDFSPDNLLTKIEIEGAMPATVIPPTEIITPPAATTPAATVPAPTVPAATTPAVPVPAATTPAATTPAATTPAVETPAATTPPATSSPLPAATTPAAPGASLGEGAMEVIVVCPHCGDRIVVRVSVNAAAAPK
jgi:hypothetical protein